MAIKKNLIWNYASFATSAAVGFIVNPLLLTFLGAAPFGAWKALQRYFDVAVAGDGGAPQALKWIIAHRALADDPEHKRQAIGAALLVWAAWLPVTISISLVLIFTVPYAMNGVPVAISASLSQAAVVLSANICLSGLFAVPTAVLIGTNSGYRAMAINVATTIVTNALLVVVSFAGAGLIGLAAVMLAGAAISFLAVWRTAARHVPWWGVDRPHRGEFIQVASHSGWVLGWSYVQRALLSSDLIIISIFLGVVYVTGYTFTSYMAQFVLSICIMTTSAFMPKLGAAIGAKNGALAREIASNMKELNFAIIVYISSVILGFNQVFISYWVGPSHFLGGTANLLIVLSVAQTAIIRNDSQLLDAALSVRGRALVGAAGCAAAVAGGIIGYWQFGTPEGLLGGALIGRVGLMMGFARLLSKAIPNADFPRKSYATGAVLLVTAYFLGPIAANMSLIQALATGLLSLFAFGLYTYFLVLRSGTRRQVGTLIRKLRPNNAS